MNGNRMDVYIFIINAGLALMFIINAFLWYITHRLIRIEKSIIICSSIMIKQGCINELIDRLEEFGLD